MLSIVDRYIAKNIISLTLVVGLVFSAVQVFIDLLGEFYHIGQAQYTLLSAFGYVLLQLPSNIYGLLPILALLGTLMGLGRLASNSELIVMRASGMSLRSVAFAVLKTGVILLVITVFIGEAVAPSLLRLSNRMQHKLLHEQKVVKLQHNVWLRDQNNYLKIGAVQSDQHLSNISRYQFDSDKHLVTTSFAQTADNINGNWLFKNVVVNHYQDAGVTTQHVASQYWPIQLKLDSVTVVDLDPSSLLLNQLYAYIHNRMQGGLSVGSYQLNFWQRIVQPFTVLVMMLLAVPFVFGPLRSATSGFKLFVGVVVGFGFYIINQFFGPLSLVYQFSPIVGAVMPTVMALGLYTWLRNYNQ